MAKLYIVVLWSIIDLQQKTQEKDKKSQKMKKISK